MDAPKAPNYFRKATLRGIHISAKSAQKSSEIIRNPAFPHNLKDSKPDSAASFRNDMAKWYDLRTEKLTTPAVSPKCKAVIFWQEMQCSSNKLELKY